MSNLIDENTTVRELAAKYPVAVGIFERFGIDYCCGGGETFVAAAAEHGVSVEALRSALEAAIANQFAPGSDAERDWTAATLTDLVNHIENKHHAFMKAQLPRLAELADHVMRAHGDHHRKVLGPLQATFEELREEIEQHLMKEEQILFPHIRQMDSASAANEPLPEFHCGSIENPIARMEQEHENAGRALARMRELTHNHTPPSDACPTFVAYYEGLRALESDLHQHIHLENNILFPRAIGYGADRRREVECRNSIYEVGFRRREASALI